MTKLLDQAIAKVRELPDEEQEPLARVLLSMAEVDASAFPLDAATEAAIREGLAQAERGEFVADEVSRTRRIEVRHGPSGKMLTFYPLCAERTKAIRNYREAIFANRIDLAWQPVPAAGGKLAG